MATKVGLGVPLPLIAPASAAWAAPFAAYYLFLQNRIVYYRISTKTFMGDTADSSRGTADPLYKASRCQLNFVENVPIAFIIAILAELNGANKKYVNYALGTLLALRISHAEFGVIKDRSSGYGRAVGYYGTQALVATLAGYVAYLVKDYWWI